MMWLLVGLGGALGSMARYGVNQAAALWLPAGFPFATFLVNAIGCTIFGVLAGIGERHGVLTPALRAFCLTGVLGGLTTFSSYAHDSFDAAARAARWGWRCSTPSARSSSASAPSPSGGGPPGRWPDRRHALKYPRAC